MRNDYYSNSKDYINRWVISYSDFVTMLLALFMVLYAVSSMDKIHVSDVKMQIEQAFQEKEYKIKSENQEIINELNKIVNKSETTKNSEFISTERGVVIRINNNTLFDEGSAIIKSGSVQTLDKIAMYLSHIDNKIIIEGHTDSTPIKNSKYQSNWELSTIRATNIIEYLISKYAIDPKRFSALGYGEFSPLDTNKTDSGRKQNRRVNILILNSNN